MKRFLFVFVIFSLALSGCNYEPDIDEQAFVIAIGVEPGEEYTLKTTFMFGNPSSGGEGAENSSAEDNTDIVTLEAPSIYSAVRRMNSVKSKKINLSHTKMVVFSDELAKEGIGDIISGLASAREFRPNTYIAISRGSADRYLRGIKPKQETFPDKYFDHIMNKVVTDNVNESYLYFLYFNITDGNFGNIVPLVGINKQKSDSEKSKIYTDDFSVNDFAGGIIEDSENPAELSGSAIIKGDKMVGVMGSLYTNTARLICNEFYPDDFTFLDPKSKRMLTVRILQHASPKIKTNINNGVAEINISVPIDIEFVNPSDAIKTNEDSDNYLNYVTELFDKSANTIVKASQKKYQCDILGLGEKMKHHFQDLNEWEKFDWKNSYQNAKIKVKFYVYTSDYEEVD